MGNLPQSEFLVFSKLENRHYLLDPSLNASLGNAQSMNLVLRSSQIKLKSSEDNKR